MCVHCEHKEIQLGTVPAVCCWDSSGDIRGLGLGDFTSGQCTISRESVHNGREGTLQTKLLRDRRRIPATSQKHVPSVSFPTVLPLCMGWHQYQPQHRALASSFQECNKKSSLQTNYYLSNMKSIQTQRQIRPVWRLGKKKKNAGSGATFA